MKEVSFPHLCPPHVSVYTHTHAYVYTHTGWRVGYGLRDLEGQVTTQSVPPTCCMTGTVPLPICASVSPSLYSGYGRRNDCCVPSSLKGSDCALVDANFVPGFALSTGHWELDIANTPDHKRKQAQGGECPSLGSRGNKVASQDVNLGPGAHRPNHSTLLFTAAGPSPGRLRVNCPVLGPDSPHQPSPMTRPP